MLGAARFFPPRFPSRGLPVSRRRRRRGKTNNRQKQSSLRMWGQCLGCHWAAVVAVVAAALVFFCCYFSTLICHHNLNRRRKTDSNISEGQENIAYQDVKLRTSRRKPNTHKKKCAYLVRMIRLEKTYPGYIQGAPRNKAGKLLSCPDLWPNKPEIGIRLKPGLIKAGEIAWTP